MIKILTILTASILIFFQTNLKADVAMIGVVNGMVCMECQAKVTKELQAATGESNVEVSWPEGVAFINFKSSFFNYIFKIFFCKI